MSVFTVHLKGSTRDAAALERAILVREGFVWSAALFGPLWLLWKRLWAPLLGFVVIEACILGLGATILSASGAFWLQALLHAALGFEASQIRRRALIRNGFRLVDVRQARNKAEAEHAFFEGAIEHQEPPPGALARPGSPQPGLVGLFPSAGA